MRRGIFRLLEMQVSRLMIYLKYNKPLTHEESGASAFLMEKASVRHIYLMSASCGMQGICALLRTDRARTMRAEK